jgi:hypothetical protein
MYFFFTSTSELLVKIFALLQSFARSIKEKEAKLLKQNRHRFIAVLIFHCCAHGKLSSLGDVLVMVFKLGTSTHFHAS